MMCNTLRMTALTVGLLSLGAAAQSALAAPNVFFGLDNQIFDISPRPNSDAAFNQFLGSLSSYGVEPVDGIDTSFEVFPGVNVAFDPTLVFRQGPTGTGAATGITATSQGVFATDGTPSQNYAIGTKSISESEALGASNADTRFTFSQPITAFGLYVIQGGDTVSNPITFQLANTITGDLDQVVVNVGPGWLDHNIFFVGFGSAMPFNQVTLVEAFDGDGMVYDNVVAGTFVPEPSSLVLLMLGGAATLCRRARFRRS